MRLLWEIFTVFAALGVLFAIGKGFPQFGGVLRFLLLNPVGLLCSVGLFVWMIVLRQRAADRRAAKQQNPS